MRLPHILQKTSPHNSNQDNRETGLEALEKKIDTPGMLAFSRPTAARRSKSATFFTGPLNHLSSHHYTKAGASSSISCLNPYPAATSSKKKTRNKDRNKIKDKASDENPKSVPPSQNENLVTDPDPAKQLRNLRKKLRDTEALEAKLLGGQIKNPDPEQLEKVSRKRQVEDKIRALEGLVAELSVAVENHE